MAAPPIIPISTDTAGFQPVNDQAGDLDDQLIIAEAVPGGYSELPDSPIIVLGEHCSVTRMFQGFYDVLRNMMRFPGTLTIDGAGNSFRTLTSKLVHKKGNRALLTIMDEWVAGGGLIPPPDLFTIEPVEFNPAVEKNPLFSDGIDPHDGGLTDEDILRIKQSVDAPQPVFQAGNAFNAYTGQGTSLADLWDILLSMLRRGEETYYLAGFKFAWTRYYFQQQKADPGGYTQAPGSDDFGDIVPSFFIRTTAGDLVLPFTASTAWLRTADQTQWERTWFRVTRSWTVGQNGFWDGDLYGDYYGTNDGAGVVPPGVTNPATY